MWWLLAALLLALALLLFLKRLTPARTPQSMPKAASPYRPRKYLLTRSESSFFLAASKSLPPGYLLFPKVRLCDLVEISVSGKEYWSAFGQISQKHIDFLVTDQSFRPILAVELDGSSHSRQKQQRSDAKKNEVLASVGLPLLRYQTGTEWDLSLLTNRLSDKVPTSQVSPDKPAKP